MLELRRYLWLSQTVFLVGLLICTAIMPSIAVRNGGVSNFGNYWSTAVFYSLGFLLNVIFLYLAARSTLKIGPNQVFIARNLKVLAFFTLIVFLSTFPRRFSFTYSHLHDYLGIVLYGYQFLISVWIVLKWPTKTTIALLVMQAIGSLIGLLSALEVFYFLFTGQAIASLGFGLLLCIVLPRVIETKL